MAANHDLAVRTWPNGKKQTSQNVCAFGSVQAPTYTNEQTAAVSGATLDGNSTLCTCRQGGAHGRVDLDQFVLLGIQVVEQQTIHGG